MFKFRLSLVPLYLALFLLGVGISACSQGKESTPTASPKIENSAKESAPPAIILTDAALLETLLNDAKGTVTVLNFWATWCPPCVKEMPDFAKFYTHFDKDKVTFVSLSANDPDKIEEEVRPFQEEKDLPFPIYVLNANNPEAFYRALRVELSGALPATIIYGKDGLPVQVWEKDTTFAELKEAVEPLL